MKDVLKENTAAAVAAGAFGSPTMLVSGLGGGGDAGDAGAEEEPLFFFGSGRVGQLAVPRRGPMGWC